jgi:probable phosphoglycerate mutase
VTNANGKLTLHFVRHGETDFNAERRIQGQMPEVGLSARGIEQAVAVAEELAACGAGALYASDLGRTMQTAEPIARRLGLEIIPEPALREKHFGVLQGRLYSEVDTIVNGWWTRHDELFEGGESNRQMYERVAGFLDGLRAAPPCDCIVLVTHGGTINCALTYLDGIAIEAMEWRRLANCSVHTVVV